MTYLEAIILGLVQGIAEFLPISSSGHLKLFEKLLGLPNVETDYILFDVLLHFGTLVAVLIVYHRVIADLLREALTMVHIRTPRAGETPDRPKRRMIALLIASLLPLFLILPVKDAMEKLGSSYLFIGIMLMITGLVLYMSDHFPKGEKTEKEMTLWDALLVGLAQALAVFPGLSRSGMTISAGTARGLDRSYAVQFSFLMSIPTILAAVVLQIADAARAGVDPSLLPKYLVGVVVAAASGVGAMRLLQYIARKSRFGGFAYYCWGAGILSMLLSLIS
ncbi:MAG: undecaprenyl-diphosphate phosphatase [Ruminococcaceae bacterium]|jgi:undecaprenyl-diphosphatase|nr:undecaprenyl-diphosphate phosphatase [Oscillospiraceae bacterium]